MVPITDDAETSPTTMDKREPGGRGGAGGYKVYGHGTSLISFFVTVGNEVELAPAIFIG